ncbi:MAG: hypothetical protein AAB458_02590 [Patescibacteria group bacterium]
MKKALIITGILCVIIAGVLAFLWYSSIKPSATTSSDAGSSDRTFSPFSSFVDFLTGDDSETENTEQITDNGGESTARSVYDLLSITPAYEVTDALVANAVIVFTGTTTGNILRYVERETGHIYELSLLSGVLRRLSNTTVPRIQEAYFGNNGSLIALQYLGEDGETIETFVGSVTTTSIESSSEFTGDFLAQNIQTITLHPTQPGVFYTLKAGGGTAGRLFDPVSKQIASLFSSPLSEWTALWNSGTNIYLHTKPSSSAQGFAYAIAPGSATPARVFTNTFGITLLPNPFNKNILVGSSKDTPKMSLFNNTDGSTVSLVGTTFPEKCVWKTATVLVCAIPESASSIDSWYNGSVSFSDSVWKINVETGLTDFLFDSEQTQKEFDATHLSVSSDGTILSFINKKNSHLWVASLLPRTDTIDVNAEFEENY